jgi:acyl-CoA synthetase (AMP-forming)/AMP-acid ligase II
MALIHGDDSLTFDELAEQVVRRAAWLKSRGIGFGDPVLLFIPMSIPLYRDLIALAHLGAVAVFVDAWAGIGRIEAACRTVKPRAFIGVRRSHLLRLLSSQIRRIPLKLIPSGLENIERHELPPAGVAEDHPALITFTTGSTGQPKAPVRTHGFLMAQHRALVESIGVEEDGVDMPLLPIFTLSNLASGVTSLLPRVNHRRVSSYNPAVVARDIAGNGVTSTTGSPSFYLRLADFCSERGLRLPSLRRIITGGAPVFPESARQLIEAFPDTRITIAYGSTEAEPISLIDAPDLISSASSHHGDGLPAGFPVSAIEVRCVAISEGPISVGSVDEFERMALPAGEVGEICVCGDHVLGQYLGNTEVWKESKIAAGDTLWHRTGDGGYLDEEGSLYLMGRVRQSFVHDGRRVWIFPIERKLAGIPGVTMGTVMKIGDERVVVIERSMSKGAPGSERPDEELAEALTRRGIGHDRVIVLPKIPRDPRHHSKIDYERLRSLAAERITEER